jgi:hypothetical protein
MNMEHGTLCKAVWDAVDTLSAMSHVCSVCAQGQWASRGSRVLRAWRERTVTKVRVTCDKHTASYPTYKLIAAAAAWLPTN